MNRNKARYNESPPKGGFDMPPLPVYDRPKLALRNSLGILSTRNIPPVLHPYTGRGRSSMTECEHDKAKSAEPPRHTSPLMDRAHPELI